VNMRPTVPLKRTWVKADTVHSAPSHLPPPSNYSSLSQVKSERSPSPLHTNRRLVTSGTRRFAPIPDDCLQSCTEYKQNRSKWVERCVKDMESLNLVVERKLIRDDGLIIDWRSHVPVLSDTLKPDPQDLAATIMLTHRSNAERRHSSFPIELPTEPVTTLSFEQPPDGDDAEPPPKKRVLAPPRPSPRRKNDSSQPIIVNPPSSGSGSSSLFAERPQFRDETDCDCQVISHLPSRNYIHSVADHPPMPLNITPDDQVVVPSNFANKVLDQSIASCVPSAGEEEMSEMTLNYLRRYVQTYEVDRASLASAYAKNASFAYRVHQIVEQVNASLLPIRTASPRSFSSGTKRARLDIVTTLLTLPCLHADAQHSTTAQLEYDIFYLGADLGMFAVCRAVISAKTVVHNFILQRKEVDVDDAASEGVWPLTATAHQILVFQT